VREEEKEVGVVAFTVYRAYWSAVGNILAPVILLALFLMQGVCVCVCGGGGGGNGHTSDIVPYAMYVGM